jgi:hypothetical protein
MVKIKAFSTNLVKLRHQILDKKKFPELGITGEK